MIVKMKEIWQEFNAAKRHFNHAIKLAKMSVVVGEINFPEKKARIKKAKVTPEPEGKADLADLDKDNKFYNGKK